MDNFKKTKKSFVTNAAADQYYLYYLDDIPTPCNTGIVGYVKNYSNPQLKVRIVIDDDFMERHNYKTIGFAPAQKYEQESCLVLSSNYFAELRDNEYMDSSIWHEIGHFHTSRYFNTRFENGSMNNYRVEAGRKGIVLDEEQVADLFALFYMNKESVLKYFRWMIVQRNKTVEENEYKGLAISELRNRREIIKNQDDSDEAVIEKICLLCKHKDFSTL